MLSIHRARITVALSALIKCSPRIRTDKRVSKRILAMEKITVFLIERIEIVRMNIKQSRVIKFQCFYRKKKNTLYGDIIRSFNGLTGSFRRKR